MAESAKVNISHKGSIIVKKTIYPMVIRFVFSRERIVAGQGIVQVSLGTSEHWLEYSA